jgi:hypothetical protein
MKKYVKKYEVTYAPTIELAQEVVNPYDDWDSNNVMSPYYYVSAYNHSREKTKTVIVEAPNKEIAKAMLAVEVFRCAPNHPIKGGIDPLIFDAVKNVKEIKEID